MNAPTIPGPATTSRRLRRVLDAVWPHGRTPLRAILAEDRFLAIATAALFVLACIPLFLTPILPFSDQGVNTASAELMWDAAFGHQPIAQYYRVQWAPVPYWTIYGLSCLFGRVVGPLIAAKLVTALIFAIIPLGTMRLLSALGRDPRLGLWAFVLSWEHNLYAGWASLLFGFGLAMFILAWMIEARGVADGFRIAPFAALLGLTHIQASWLLALAGGLVTFTMRPLKRRVAITAAAFSGPAIVIVPWLLIHLWTGSGGSGLAGLQTEWHSAAYKISQFFAYTLDNFSRPDAERTAAAAFALLTLGPLLLGLLPARGTEHRASAAVLLLSALALYAFLPWALWGSISHWYTYPRYATVILLWLLLIPRPSLRGRATWALAPGLLLAVLLDVRAGQQLASFGETARAFMGLVKQVRAGTSVLPLILDDADADPDLKLPPYHQFYGYIAAETHGVSPALWVNPSIPLIMLGETRLPQPGDPRQFSMDTEGRFYDYVLVQGITHGDPVAARPTGGGKRAVLQYEVGRWRLYRVE